MIVIKFLENGLKKTFSDYGHKIRKVGTDEVYAEAIDSSKTNYIYEETDELIEVLDTVEEMEIEAGDDAVDLKAENTSPFIEEDYV